MPHGTLLIGGEGKENAWQSGIWRDVPWCHISGMLCRDTRHPLYVASLNFAPFLLSTDSFSRKHQAPPQVHPQSLTVCQVFIPTPLKQREYLAGSQCCPWGPPDIWRTLPKSRLRGSPSLLGAFSADGKTLFYVMAGQEILFSSYRFF